MPWSPPRARPLRGRLRALYRALRPEPYSGPGVAIAVVLCAFALTPSLLPRPPAFQGLVCGVSLAAGYGIGSTGRGLVRLLVRGQLSRALVRRGRRVVIGGGAALLSLMLWRSAHWQQEAHRLVDKAPPEEASPVLIVGIAVSIFLVLVGLARTMSRSARLIAHPLSRTLPRTAAVAVAVAAVIATSLVVVERLVAGPGLTVVDRAFSAANDLTRDDVRRPTSPLRSGGPGSASPWDRLGAEGRRFVAGGPSAQDLAVFHGPGVREPIRVYAGLDSDRDLEDLARLVLSELERTGAFDRAVLCVAVPTGRGWINPAAARALEYLWGGDTAIASLQYSYLPSALEFLIDSERAQAAGRALFDTIYAHWSQLPADARPLLVVYGESLGSTGAQAPFDDLADLRARTDGAMFVGPPESNRLWQESLSAREPDSPMVRPVVNRGRQVRLGSTRADVYRPGLAEWEHPRVLFLQHPSDPVVWWSPDLLLRRPAWLSQPRGHDVSPRMRWYPIVTFLQVTGDMAVANAGPTGHGHRYGDFVRHWAALVPPPGWTDGDTDRLSRLLS